MDPKQLELDLQGGDATPVELGLTINEMAMVLSLCHTARDFLWGKLLTDSVPAEHAHRIKSVCHAADALIDKLEKVFKPQMETH